MIKKYTVIYVSGFEGNPKDTSNSLREALENAGHKVVLVDVTNIRSKADREQRCRAAIDKAMQEVILIGSSAGAEAVNNAANDSPKVKGVVMLGPAIPRRFGFWTKDLFKVFLKIFFKLLFKKEVLLTKEQFLAVMQPLSDDKVPEHISPICSKEVLELVIRGVTVPIHKLPIYYAFGTNERLLNPNAHLRYLAFLLKKYQDITYTEVPGGHLVLFSDESEILNDGVSSWIASLI